MENKNEESEIETTDDDNDVDSDSLEEEKNEDLEIVSDVDDDDNDDSDITIDDDEKSTLSKISTMKEFKKRQFKVPDEDRITRNILTKYEKTKLLGTRVNHLNKGAKPMIKTDLADFEEIAELELQQKKLPLKIKRNLPRGLFEIWKLSELKIDIYN